MKSFEILLPYAIIGILLYFVFKNISGFAKDRLLPSKKNWPSTSLSDNELDNIADSIFYNMYGFGSEFNDMMNTLKDLNGQDLKHIYNSFGRRAYLGFGRAFGIGTYLDLFGWFKQELSKKELNQMRELWNKSGLKLTF